MNDKKRGKYRWGYHEKGDPVNGTPAFPTFLFPNNDKFCGLLINFVKLFLIQTTSFLFSS